MPRFDFGFLNHELGRAGHEPICMTRMVDTLAIARTRHPGAKHSLDALCTRYGIDRSHRVKHGALLDAQLLAQLYVELTGGRQIGLSLRADAATPSRRSASLPDDRRATCGRCAPPGRMPPRWRNLSVTRPLSLRWPIHFGRRRHRPVDRVTPQA